MEIFVLTSWWDTPDVEGYDVIGVYKSHDEAVEKMKENVADIKEQFPDDFWDDDMTWEDDDSIHLGHMSTDIYCPATIYSWDITAMYI